MKRIAATLLISIGCAAAAEPPFTPADFGYGREFVITDRSALYEAVMPDAIYSRLTRADFGDLRIFNGANEILPHALREPAVEHGTPVYQSAPFFPVYAGTQTPLAGLSLHVRQDASGNIVNIETKKPAGGQKHLAAYLIDAHALKQPVRALRVAWKNPRSDFVATYHVAASDDLQAWRPLNSATLAELNFNGQLLSRRDIEFPATQAKFLRLSWDPGAALPILAAVQLEIPGNAREAVRGALPLQYIDAPKPGEYRYRMIGNAPLDRVHIGLQVDNALAQIELLARNHDKEPWQAQAHGVIYRLQRPGGTLTNPPIQLSGRTPAREWLLRVSPDNALGTTVPTVEFGFIPHTVTFVARGPGPYVLAYGARGLNAPHASLTSLLDTLQQNQREALPVTLSDERVLGGAARIAEPGFAARTWKTWVLWSALLLGVAFLALMARRLLHEMKTHG